MTTGLAKAFYKQQTRVMGRSKDWFERPAAKQLTRDLGPRIDEAVVDHTIAALAARWETEKAAEWIGVFFDKRKPGWVD